MDGMVACDYHKTIHYTLGSFVGGVNGHSIQFVVISMDCCWSRLMLVCLLIATLTHPSLGTSGAVQQPSLQAEQHQHSEAAAQQHGAVATAAVHADSSLQPPIWPEQFKAVMFQNRTNRLALVQLYYDWKLGANLNLIASQLGAAGTVWDVEWNNGMAHRPGTVRDGGGSGCLIPAPHRG